jgi:ABC-type sugar transport system permease subunit
MPGNSAITKTLERAGAGRARARSYRLQHFSFVLAVLVPLVAFFAIFWLYPIARGLWGSLTLWDAFNPEAPFVGLDNYVRAAGDPIFRASLRNTFVYALITVFFQTLLGLVLALAIDSSLRTRGLFRTIYFLPYITPVIATALLWKFLYQPSLGLFNQLLSLAHLPPQDWLLSTAQALPSIAFYSIWKNVGFTMVIFMAGLAGIPRDYMDAARVDGAGRWQLFRHVTLPLLRPTLIFVLVVRVIFSFQEFGPFYVMTDQGAGLPGGPNNSTIVLAIYQWLMAFRELQLGYGSAMGLILFLIILVVTFVQLRALRTRWEY